MDLNRLDENGTTPKTDENGEAAMEYGSNNELTQSICDFDQYIGEDVAGNIATSMMRLDEMDGELVAQTQDVCRRIAEGQIRAWFGTDDVTMALAIIRVASEELDDTISYPTLMDTLERGEGKVYRVSAMIRDKI
jgi:hypothetical protein